MEEGEDWHSTCMEGQMDFLRCTNIIVMLSHPSPVTVDGARQWSRTLSQTLDSLFSCDACMDQYEKAILQHTYQITMSRSFRSLKTDREKKAGAIQ